MEITDTNTPLHLLQPDYNIPYEIPLVKSITKQLEKILLYLEKATSIGLVNGDNQKFEDYNEIDKNTKFCDGDFRLTSYEWGVTYSAMLNAAEVLKDKRFLDYTTTRLNFLEATCKAFKKLEEQNIDYKSPLHSVLYPAELDDAGALCTAMIKTQQATGKLKYNTLIDNFADYICNKQFRFADGTFARNRPHPNTLWIDDLYMSVPSLANLGNQTNDLTYFDDATKQVIQFAERMFRQSKGLFIHGWVKEMKHHPEYYWGRANGWALLAMIELLELLPETHNKREKIFTIFKNQAEGIARLQAESGFWYQLLDRNNSYEETSATAIFTYCFARGINTGYLGAKEYGPAVILAWNAINSKINSKGQIKDTCVGTGMGFDPAFYFNRPVSVYAAHGYGPVLLAGSEVIRFIQNHNIKIIENALQVYPK